MKCDECNGSIVDIDGELTCNTCGVVHSEILANPKPAKVEHNKMSHWDNENDNAYGLGSVIGPENMKGASKLRRLATWNNGEDRKMKKVSFFINIVKSEFGLQNSAKRDMINYYSTLASKNILSSRMTLEERSAAIGYIVIKEYGYGYTLKEICKQLDVPMKKIGKASRLYARHLGKSHVFAMANPHGIIEKHCSRFTENRKFMADILDLYYYLDNIETTHPSTQYLAGITYFVEKLKPSKEYTKKEIAEAFDTNVRRITEVVRRIKERLSIEDTFGLTVENILEGIR